ncbi:MAG TPA: acyltransferase [Vicinamibacterales bacterium]
MQVHVSAEPRASGRPRAAILLKGPALAVAWLAAHALIGCYRLGAFSFLTSSRLLALVPGAFGIRVRRYWYRGTLARCGEDLVVEWLTALKTADARIGSRVAIGPMCWIAEVEIGDDVMIGSRVAIQGGGRTHGFDRVDIPMNQQPGQLSTVVIGRDVWIGTGATVMADVAEGTIVGAGAVVTSTFPSFSILGGVPARVIGHRGSPPARDNEDA